MIMRVEERELQIFDARVHVYSGVICALALQQRPAWYDGDNEIESAEEPYRLTHYLFQCSLIKTRKISMGDIGKSAVQRVLLK